MKSKLIAPCGMNCGLCIAFLRDKNKCPGCRYMDDPESKYCKQCSIRNCEIRKNKGLKFCSNKCEKYPCTRLKNLDKRYRTKYHMSMIENLENIESKGVRKFVQNEKKRWKCKKCNCTICVHKGICLNCNN